MLVAHQQSHMEIGARDGGIVLVSLRRGGGPSNKCSKSENFWLCDCVRRRPGCFCQWNLRPWCLKARTGRTWWGGKDSRHA